MYILFLMSYFFKSDSGGPSVVAPASFCYILTTTTGETRVNPITNNGHDHPSAESTTPQLVELCRIRNDCPTCRFSLICLVIVQQVRYR